MTRRLLIVLLPVGAAAVEDPINTGNRVSQAGEAVDRAFLDWGAVWNKREYGTRSVGEKVAWERYKRALDKFLDAHKEWERGY